MSSAVATPPVDRLALIRKIAMRDKKLARLAKNFEVVDARYTNPTENENDWKHDVADAFETMMKTPTVMNPLVN